MRKIGMSLLIVLVTSACFAQERTTETATQDRNGGELLPIEGLSSDADFIRYLNNVNNLMMGIADKKAFNDISIGEEIDERTLTTIATACGLKSGDAFKEYVQIQSNLLSTLNKRYGFANYESKELEDHLFTAISNVGINDLSALSDRCLSTLNNSIISHAAAATMGYIGCGYSSFVPIAAASCAGLVLAVHILADNAAWTTYFSCVESR
jgi:hypothetical protein